MATQFITPSMRKRAEQMADEAGSWLRATSRVNGRSFFIVPNSTGSAAYYCDFNHCTCRGNQYRGICSHVEAVRVMERRRMAEMAEEAWQAENDALFAGFTKHEVDPAPALPEPEAAPRFTRDYHALYGPDDDTVDAY